MKKVMLVFVLFFILAGALSADHPENNLGLGVMGGWHGNWESLGGWGHGYTAFSLKIPKIPIFWALNLGFSSKYFILGISGDKYLFERDLVSEINLHWMIGLGAWVNLGLGDAKGLEVGGRLPIGVSWHILSFLELFTDVAPSLGIKLIPDFYFPAGGWPLEIGVRFWLY
jgi:hypothetical protein